jgi:hypothetical protein
LATNSATGQVVSVHKDKQAGDGGLVEDNDRLTSLARLQYLVPGQNHLISSVS